MRVGKADGEAWLRLSEAADLLGVSLNTLRRWSDSGKLLCYRSPGGHRRYRRADAEALLRHQAGADATAETDAQLKAGGPAEAGARDAAAQPALATLAQVAAQGLGMSSCVIATVGDDGLLRVASGFSDVGAPDDTSIGRVLTRAQAPVADEVQHTHRRVVIADVASTNLLTPAEVNACRQRQDAAVLALPLSVDGRLLGVMQLVARRAPRAFTAANVAFAEFVARQAAGLIANEAGDSTAGIQLEAPSRTRPDPPVAEVAGPRDRVVPGGDPTAMLKRRIRDLETIVQAGLEDAARLSTDEVLHAVVQRLADLTRSPVADVYAVEGGTLRALISYDAGRFDPEWEGVVVPIDRYPCSRRAVESGEIAIAVSLEDPILGAEGRSSLERWGYQSQLSMPLLAAGRVIGLIELSDYVPRDFGEDLELVRGLGRVAAQGLENARLFELVERRSRILNELVDLGTFASTARDFDTVLRHVAERLLDIVGAANCDIYQATDKGLLCVVSHDRSGFDEDAAGRPLDVSLYPSLAAAGGQLFVVSSPDDPQLSKREREVYREYGFSSEVCVPLIANDELFGLIDIYDTRSRSFSEYLSFLRSLGMSLAGTFASRLLLDQLERGTTALREIVELGALAAQGGDLSDLLETLSGRVLALVGAAGCDVYTLDGDTLRCLASVDGRGSDREAVGAVVRVADYPVMELALRTREPLVVASLDDPRVTEHERGDYADWGFKSLVSIPLSFGDEVVGAIDLFDTRERDYGEYLDFLRQAAQIVAGALEKTRLAKGLEQANTQLAHLVEAGLEFGATLDDAEVLLRVAERLCTAAQARCCGIYRIQGDALRCLASVKDGAPDDDSVGAVYGIERFGGMREAIAAGRMIVVADIESDARMSTFERAENLRSGHRAKVELPLVAGGQTIGLASIFDDKARAFGDLELLQSLAQVAANALANATLHDELDRSADRIALVGDVSFELSSSLDLDEVLANTAHRLCALADMPCCDLYTLDDERRLTCVVSLVEGETDKGWQGRSFSLEHWSAMRTAVERRMPIVISSPEDPLLNADERKLMGQYAETAEIIFPLISKDVVIGVLELLETRGPRTFREDEVATISAVCRVAALAIHNAKLFDDIRRLHIGNLKALSSALNAKDYYTLGHAARVAAYMVLLGEELGWDPELLRGVEEAAYLHDIGKIGVSDRVLLKPGNLNPREWDLMRKHPAYSADIIRALFGEELTAGVRHHHERYDGSGYPDGLAGDAIPAIARAMCVADAYDAMSFRRPYRQALSYAACREELARCAWSQFDPAMAAAFERVLDRLSAQKTTAVMVAAEAARRLDHEAHATLRRREDEDSEAYRRVAATLRAVRDEHPPTRYLTTFVRSGSASTLVADAEEDEALRSHIGDETFSDEEILRVFAGQPVDRTVLFVDHFGVWISGAAPVRDKHGEIVAVANADLPATAGVTEVDGLRSDVTQTFAAMVEDAAARLVHAELEEMTDGLTGLYSHRYLHERLDEEIERCVYRGGSLALLLVDLDDFRTFNDRYGHSAGDHALREVAHIIETSLRQVDLAARFGGEEFAVILIDADEAGANEVAERVRNGIVGTEFTLGHESLSVSIGIALCPGDATHKEELLDKADWAMYLAKRRGRDQVVSFSAEHGALTPEQALSVHDDHVSALAGVVAAREALGRRRRAAVTHLALAVARELALTPDEMREVVVAVSACGEGAGAVATAPGRLPEHIAAVAARYESLVTRPPYRPQISESEALQELRSCPAFEDDARLWTAFEAVLARPRA